MTQCGRSDDAQHILASPRIRERNEATNLYYPDYTADTNTLLQRRITRICARDASTKPFLVFAADLALNCRGSRLD